MPTPNLKPHWTADGHIDIQETTEELFMENIALCRELLRECCYQVWADAYAEGWSDGVNGRAIKIVENPYKRREE